MWTLLLEVEGVVAMMVGLGLLLGVARLLRTVTLPEAPPRDALITLIGCICNTQVSLEAT